MPHRTLDELRARTRAMAGGTPVPPPLRLSVLPLAPCPHEGAILSHCHGCQSADRHVRWCHHPEHHSCVRNAPDKASEDVTNCATCPHHPANVTPPTGG